MRMPATKKNVYKCYVYIRFCFFSLYICSESFKEIMTALGKYKSLKNVYVISRDSCGCGFMESAGHCYGMKREQKVLKSARGRKACQCQPDHK